MTITSEAQGLIEQFDPAALAAATAAAVPEQISADAPAPVNRSGRASLLALAVCAIAVNGAAALYTWPSEFSLATVGSLAEWLPHRDAPVPKPDPVATALQDIRSAQQQHAASLQENNHALEKNAALLQQDSMVLLSLRQSITDERIDVRKISSQLSTLLAKVDALQNTMMSDVTSSIRRANARYGLSAVMRKKIARQSRSVGPVSVGGAPLTTPAAVTAPES